MKRLTIEITDLEWQAFADIVVDPRQWARSAVKGKVAKCVERVVDKEQKRLLDDPAAETIPATAGGILESYFAQPHYKARLAREAAQEAAMAASMNISESDGE